MAGKTELAQKVQAMLDDVYVGNGESVIIGEVVFDRTGFNFKESRVNTPTFSVDATEYDGTVWIEFYEFGTKPVVVGIPMEAIQ